MRLHLTQAIAVQMYYCHTSLLFGCLLRCLDPILTVAAVLTSRSVFVSPQDKLAEARAYGGVSQSFIGLCSAVLTRFWWNMCRPSVD